MKSLLRGLSLRPTTARSVVGGTDTGVGTEVFNLGCEQTVEVRLSCGERLVIGSRQSTVLAAILRERSV